MRKLRNVTPPQQDDRDANGSDAAAEAMTAWVSSPEGQSGGHRRPSDLPGDLTLSELRAHLLAVVKREGYLRLEEPVQLRSGEWSRDFIDGKRALAHGADLELACKALIE